LQHFNFTVPICIPASYSEGLSFDYQPGGGVSLLKISVSFLSARQVLR